MSWDCDQARKTSHKSIVQYTTQQKLVSFELLLFFIVILAWSV